MLSVAGNLEKDHSIKYKNKPSNMQQIVRQDGVLLYRCTLTINENSSFFQHVCTNMIPTHIWDESTFPRWPSALLVVIILAQRAKNNVISRSFSFYFFLNTDYQYYGCSLNVTVYGIALINACLIRMTILWSSSFLTFISFRETSRLSSRLLIFSCCSCEKETTIS